jgi:hypothetical protein
MDQGNLEPAQEWAEAAAFVWRQIAGGFKPSAADVRLLDGPIPGSAAGWSIDTFAQQLGGQVARESGNTGTIVCLTMPSGEASSDRRVRGSRVLERPW